MAITRAQQVKQMLREGGRIGRRRGGIERGFQAPSKDKPGQSPRGSSFGGGVDASKSNFGPPESVRRGGGKDSIKVSPSYGKDQYEGTTEMGFVDEKPIVPIPSDTTKEFRDKKFEPPTFPPGAKFVTNFFKGPLQAGMTYDRNFFVDKVLKAGRIGITPLEFSKLSTDEQEEVFDKFTKLRNAGLTDAMGNLKSGVRREMIPFKKADGTIEMREQIIDNRDDGPRYQILFS